MRKNVVRRSINLSRRNSKAIFKENVHGFDDQNNNRHSQGNVLLDLNSGEGPENTYDSVVLTFSTDCDIIDSNTKHVNQQYRTER